MKKVLLFSLFVLLFACSEKETSDKFEIFGEIHGYDESPLATAHAQVVALGSNGPIDTALAAVDGEGTYKIEIDSADLYEIRFTGVFHKILNYEFAAPKGKRKFEINARLEPNYLNSPLTEVYIIDGESSGEDGGVHMKPAPGGTLKATVPTEKGVLKYRILGAAKDGANPYVAGTQADKYELGKDGFYIAVIESDKPNATVTFEPRKLMAPLRNPSVWSDDEELDAVFDVERDSYAIEQKAASCPNIEKMIRGTLEMHEKMIEKHTIGTSKAAAILEYLDAANLASIMKFDSLVNVSYVGEIEEILEPTDPFWRKYFYVPAIMLKLKNDEATFAYVEKVALENPYQRVSENALLHIGKYFLNKNEPEKAQKYYDELKSKYPESRSTKELKKLMDSAEEKNEETPV